MHIRFLTPILGILFLFSVARADEFKIGTSTQAKISSAGFSEDGSTMAIRVGDRDSNKTIIEIRSTKSGELISSISTDTEGGLGSGSHLTLNYDGSLLAGFGHTGEECLTVNTKTGETSKKVPQISYKEAANVEMQFAGTGTDLLASLTVAGNPSIIRRVSPDGTSVDVGGPAQRAMFSWCKHVSSPDGNRLLVSTQIGLQAGDLSTKSWSNLGFVISEIRPADMLDGRIDDSGAIVVIGANKIIHLTPNATGYDKKVVDFEKRAGSFAKVVVSADGKSVYVADGHSGLVNHLDSQTGKLVETVNIPQDFVPAEICHTGDTLLIHKNKAVGQILHFASHGG